MKKTLVAFLIGLTLPATTIADTLKPVQNDVSTRIIGGEPANTSDWKFIASLVRKGQPTSIGHFCGGRGEAIQQRRLLVTHFRRC